MITHFNELIKSQFFLNLMTSKELRSLALKIRGSFGGMF